MALWPNNYQGLMGFGPFRHFCGARGLYEYKGTGGNRFGIHTVMAKTSSVPEGVAPFGTWVMPRTAGGMSSSAARIGTLTGTGALKNGGAMSGTGTMALTGTGNLSLIVTLSGTGTLAFSVSPATLTLVLAMTGNGTMTFNVPPAPLALIVPMTGTFTGTLSGAADLKMLLSLSGTFNNSQGQLTLSDIAAAVWDEPVADHLGAGSTGNALNNAGAGGDPSVIAAAVWDETLADHLDPGSTGAKLNTGGSGDPAAIAAAVWDEPIADHLDPGSTGEKLDSGGGSGGLTPAQDTKLTEIHTETTGLQVDLEEIKNKGGIPHL